MGYSHHVRGKKAVSPVVATLILILIAVAAAAALYLWLVAWQGGVTKGIGSPGAQYTVSIGGSTSAYPFAEEAATQFEANNSDVVISVNQGGSGAGAAAVCSGQVDIGQASSFAYPVSTLISADGCPSTTVEQVIAYDGVDVITPSANSHGLQSISWDTLQAIWTTASDEPVGYGGTTGTGSAPGSPVANLYANGGVFMNGVEAPTADQIAQGDNYAWDQIPACAEAQATCAIYGGVDVAATTDPLMPFAAGTVTETGTSTLTTVPTVVCGTGGTGTFAGTSVFAIDGYNNSKTFTFPTITDGCGGGGQVFTDPTPLTVYSAVQTSSTQVTVTWSGAYTWAATGTGTANPVASATTATLTTVNQNLVTPVSVSSTQTGFCAAPSAAKSDICGTYTAATTINTPGSISTVCGYAVCAGGTSSTIGHAIDLYYRSDVSGTTTGFLARLLAVSASGGSAYSLSFTGCGGDNEFDGCGLAFSGSNDHGESGNPAVIAAVAGDANGLGYASDGLAQASNSGVVPVNFQGYGQSVVVTVVGESTALKAIAKGISDYFTDASTINSDQAYVGWRPFVNIETSPPTGEVERYLEFVMDPANNQNIAAETAEISIYASGLAGVVPITPISGSTDLP